MQISIQLDEKCETPLYRQIVDGVEKLIKEGQLKPGGKMPSTRELSEHLGISRFTAARAYEELARTGLIETSCAVGTFVSTNQPQPALAGDQDWHDRPASQDTLSSYGCRLMSYRSIEAADAELFAELNYSAPPAELLPATKWKELLVRASRNREVSQASYRQDVFGFEPLRKALADYLARSRGMHVSHEQICVFSGAQTALDLLGRVLIDPGDLTVVENPGFPGARRNFACLGGDLEAVAVDTQGVVVEKLPARAKVIYLTPAHHDPTGVVMTQSRRQSILTWAKTNQTWIIEDDFDSEYRYGDKPMPALQSIDKYEQVIYLSGFWKTLFPLLSIGYLVLPAPLVPVVRRAKSMIERDFHAVEHEALAELISEGHLEKHVRKVRTLYARRRQTLIAALNKHLQSTARIAPTSAGTHLLVTFDSKIFKSDELLAAADQAKLPMVSSEAYYFDQAPPCEMLLAFAHLPEEQIEQACHDFAASLRATSK